MNKDNPLRHKLFQNKKALLISAASMALLAMMIAIWMPARKDPALLPLSALAADITNGKVLKIEDTPLTGDLVIHYRGGRTETAIRDTNQSLLEQLSYFNVPPSKLSALEYNIVRSRAAETSKAASSLITFAMIGGLAFMAFRMVGNGPLKKKTFDEGRIPSTRFNDVAGMDENLQELKDVVSFLNEGDSYEKMGARMPRGVLLVGDPGTGKTLIARAVAGEAGVPFFAISGSEFVEVFAGVGAGRVRSLFKRARKSAPCIVFIDEIDAVGRERHSAGSGAEVEADQTLNQLLVEMDGFEPSEGVVILAATNRVDVLDSALTRPGRFDRRVFVNRPDVKGREEILKVHLKGKTLADDVEVSSVARATPGLVGADLANIVNEAAIMAVRNKHEAIAMQDFEEAFEKSLAGGVQRKSSVMSAEERRIIAYHEAGHAITIHACPQADPVYKITIIPRGQAGGYTMSLPVEDNLLISRNKILARITGLMGGRAAEELFFQDVTSGAANDLQVATHLAEEMVMRLGMDSSTGLRVYPQQQGLAALAAPRGSQKTFETIDGAVRSILDTCYTQAKAVLNENRRLVDILAEELLEVETVSRDRFLELVQDMTPASQPVMVE